MNILILCLLLINNQQINKINKEKTKKKIKQIEKKTSKSHLQTFSVPQLHPCTFWSGIGPAPFLPMPHSA